MSISGVTIRNGGRTTGSGGGITNSGTLTLTNSTVSGNSGGEGGGISNGATLALINSTVSGNSAQRGGGIAHAGSLMILIDSTVSGNIATEDGGGIVSNGLPKFFGTIHLFNSTITNNQADADFNGSGTGGGINNFANTFTFQNTILAGNSETIFFGNVFVPVVGECKGFGIISNGNNLMENYDTSHCVVTGIAPTLADPKLGPLQNNGGPTQTHALLAGSPAIDAGNPNGCRDNLGALLTTDQRGFPRPVDGNNDGVAACDIGAYESTRVGAEFGEVLTGAPGQAFILAGGIESSGASRSPAFQLFDSAGTLQTTQFVLNPDFRTNVSFVMGNFDADTAGEILAGGRETSGLTRGPAYQLFDADGTFKFTRFVLNPDFSEVSFAAFNIGSNGVLACGRETGGLGRGPAYQALDTSGTLVRTQFVLNADFTADNSCMGINLDGVAGDEVIVGGREVTGLARGPTFQVFGSDGSLRVSLFALNPDFREMKLAVTDRGGTKEIVVSGREVTGLARGPVYQVFDPVGNLILTRFVLNPDFTGFQVFGANTSNSVAGDEIVTGGLESGGLARGPAIQVWDKNGNLLSSWFALNPDFTEVQFTKIDINNDGLDEILVVGRETKGFARGPAFQLFDGSGNLLVSQFVLNGDFTSVKAFAVDQNGDGDQEIGIGGTETAGFMRGPAYQIFESNGTLLQSQFVLNPDF